MSSCWKLWVLVCVVLLTALPAVAVEPASRTVTFDDSWGEPGFSVAYSGDDGPAAEEESEHLPG